MPPFLRLLAFVGILFGSMGVLGATSTIRITLDEEQWRQAVTAAQGPSPSPSPSPSPGPAENTVLIRRAPGVVVPLCVIWAILCALLFSGCLMALRGSAWGASAWRTACLGFVIFVVLLAVLAKIRLGELALAVPLTLSIYPLISLWYLRRPQIAERFR